MKFLRKLMYYMLGVGLGLILVYFLFGSRDFQCSYFPNDRVLYDLRKKELQLSDSLQTLLSRQSLDTSGLQAALQRGKINFDLSNTDRKGCKEYRVELREMQKSFQLRNCDSTAVLLEVLPLP